MVAWRSLVRATYPALAVGILWDTDHALALWYVLLPTAVALFGLGHYAASQAPPPAVLPPPAVPPAPAVQNKKGKKDKKGRGKGNRRGRPGVVPSNGGRKGQRRRTGSRRLVSPRYAVPGQPRRASAGLVASVLDHGGHQRMGAGDVE